MLQRKGRNGLAHGLVADLPNLRAPIQRELPRAKDHAMLQSLLLPAVFDGRLRTSAAHPGEQ